MTHGLIEKISPGSGFESIVHTLVSASCTAEGVEATQVAWAHAAAAGRLQAGRATAVAEAALQTREKAIAAREEAVAARELDVRAGASKNEAALASLKLREEKAAVAAASASVQETAASMLKDASDKAQASLRHAPPPPKRVEMPGCPPMSESLHMQILARATATALLKHQLAAQQKGEAIEAAYDRLAERYRL